MPVEKRVHADAALILRGAWQKIETGGWIKRQRSSGSRMCMIEAIERSDGTKPLALKEAKRLVLTLTATASIEKYNDYVATSATDVVEVLQAAEQCAKELAS